nr:uncharacterized protein LOC127319602 [Lolium perenne]
MMTPQEQAEMRAYFAELDAREAHMTPKDKAECHAYFKHLESKSDIPHESSEDVLISNNLTSTPLVLSSSLLGCSDIDDAIAMEMRDSTICEMSASTICEIESHHLEDMSDTPSEMRVVVDRSFEAIFNSNILPSTSSVFPCVSLGSMDDETPIMEKMYMVHEDDDITPCLLLEDEHGGHIEPTTSTTPTSYERDYKGTYMGVDDAMIPLVDMMTYECMHDLEDTIAMPHALFIPPYWLIDAQWGRAALDTSVSGDLHGGSWAAALCAAWCLRARVEAGRSVVEAESSGVARSVVLQEASELGPAVDAEGELRCGMEAGGSVERAAGGRGREEQRNGQRRRGCAGRARG